MLTTVTHSCGIIEVVERPEPSDPSDPYYYFAPWEEGQIQTRDDGSKFTERDGRTAEVDSYVSEHGGGVYYRALVGVP